MAVNHPQLARLQIPHQSSPPIAHPLYTPGLPTAIQQSFNMHTPLESNFTPQIPFNPHLRHGMHRAHPSLMFSGPAAVLAAAGIAPPSGMPVAPVGLAQHLMLSGPGFQRGSRRTSSISMGGPPKAPLGGPNRKHSPLPPGPVATTASTALAAYEKAKAKKVILKLPAENVFRGADEGDSKDNYSLWSRRPLAHSVTPKMDSVRPPEIMSMQLHPIEQSNSLPATIDVFLPGKAAWEEYRQKLIEEKLQRLGVERGANFVPSGQSHVHGRAASISSPADPALLLFKLNKLQQSQAASISVSPQPPSIPMSFHPPLPPRFQGSVASKHGHSISLAHFSTPPPQQSPFFNSTAPLNPFGPNLAGRDHDTPPHIHAPQGIVPLSLSMQSDTASTSSAPSRIASTIPDFNRGFGLDIPEEEEDDLETFGQSGDVVAGALLPEEGEGAVNEVDDDSTTAPAHSRHVSKVSVALSLKSMGGRSGIEIGNSIESIEESSARRDSRWNLGDELSSGRPDPGLGETEYDADPVGEWTASEDERSLGEFSNPSDEEKALQVRQARQARRLENARQRSYQDQETPRRLPDFPRPPAGLSFVQRPPSTTDEDIVSNPSEEGRTHGYGNDTWLHPMPPAEYQPVIDGQLRSPRPLPPLPHSRTASGNYSLHSALIHSRQGSSKLNERETTPLFAGPPIRRDSLNPFAKPFVFGAGDSGGKIGNISQPEAPVVEHFRGQSLGRTLNAAAAEFKPTGFTFRLPEGVPTLSFNASEVPRPLPQVPVGISPLRFQGREKRQRRSSSTDQDGERGGESNEPEMSSFRFPPPKQLASISGLHAQSEAILRAISPLPKRSSELNAAAAPFKFPSTSTLALSIAPEAPSALPYPLVPNQFTQAHASAPDMQTQSKPDAAATPEVDARKVPSETAASMHPSPSPLRKRPPVLDFKHPVSTNTVPAALFRKALVGTEIEGPTRLSVSSRLSPCENFDNMSSPSLDDTDVPAIARKSKFTHPPVMSRFHDRPSVDQDQSVFIPVSNDDMDSRGRQMRPKPTSTIASPASKAMHASYMRQHDDADQMGQALKSILDDRMELLKRDFIDAQALATGEIVDQVITAIRTHMSDFVTRQPDESTTDARGEVDFDLVRNTLEQGVIDIRTGLRRDLEDVLRSVELAKERPDFGVAADFQRVMEDFSNRTVGAVTNAVVKFASRIDQIDELACVRAADERQLLLNELFNVFIPRLESFRQQPVDFDVVTAKLAEAVKPRISQLIDLTSDKKETAELILQRLLPALSALSQTPAHVDIDAIVSQLRVEIAHMAPASDPHVIKEAVADLVVERLDSRLAVREKSVSGENLYSRISERIDDLHVPVSDVRKAVEDLRMGQEFIKEQGAVLNALHQDMAAPLLGLPETLKSATLAIEEAVHQWTITKNYSTSPDLTESFSRLEFVESAIRSLTVDHNHLASQAASLISLHEDLKTHISTLPQSLEEATASLKHAQVELLSRSQTPDHSGEMKTLLASNAELQVQIAKARGAHGQIRVEKDLMCDRMVAAESERDSLRNQLDELKSKGSATETEVTAAGLRITELEDALSHALARLHSAEVTSQAKEERIAALERQNRELGLEQYQHKAQVQKLELQSEWLTRDKETLERRLSQLQKDHDLLMAQQSHWDELHRTSEQVEQLMRLVSAADSEEVAELKRERDRYRVLEGEHTSLQKCFNEQETKFSNLDRAVQAARQSLAQAQQRASEWEKKTNELEVKLDAAHTKLDDADEAKLQLSSDLSLAKMHLKDKETAEKAAKEHEATMHAEMSSLKAELASLKVKLERVNQTNLQNIVTGPSTSGASSWRTNGLANGQNARPPSRTSTVYGGRSPVTPTDVTCRADSFSSRAPSAVLDSPTGVWGSKHAPRATGHRASSTLQHPPSSSVASPTPSTVSLAPTQGDDGWWS